MKKNANGLYEFKIGCSYVIKGLNVRCVEGEPRRGCWGCPLFNSGLCSEIACLDVEREDGCNSHFKTI